MTAPQISQSTPPPWLANIPEDVLNGRRSGVLCRWLESRHLRPTLAQLEAERARRRNLRGRNTR